MRPQLALNIEDPKAIDSYIADPNFVMQLKADGDRYLVEVNDGQVMVFNRAGMPKVSNLSYSILAQFATFSTGLWTFDGEYVNNKLLLFDLVNAGSQCTPKTPFGERYFVLQHLMKQWQPDPTYVELLPIASTEVEKKAMYRQAKEDQREGVILRNVHGIYRPAMRHRDLIKVKFVSTIDAIITAVNQRGHENVTVSLIDPVKGAVVEVGSVSARGKKGPDGQPPQEGEIWEIKFLYCVEPKAPRLYQPRLMRRRSTLAEQDAKTAEKYLHECLLDQLDNAYTNRNIVIDQGREA